MYKAGACVDNTHLQHDNLSIDFDMLYAYSVIYIHFEIGLNSGISPEYGHITVFA